MATGNKNSNFTINISSKEAEASIRRLKGEVEELESDLKKLDSTSSKYESTLKKLSTTQKLLNKEEDRYNSALKQTTVHHKNSINAIQQKISALRQEMNAMDMSSDKFKTASANMRQLSASMLEGSSATGLHAASAMELGRVFSDAPYGIRGVANNISQLGSLMAQAATSTDAATGKAIGFMGALKGLGKSLVGPLGILLAFQAVVAAIEYFASATSKAKEDVDSLNDSLENQIEIMARVSDSFSGSADNLLASILGDNWEDDLKVLNSEFSDFSSKIKSLTTEQQKDKETISFYVGKYSELLDVRGKISKSEQRSSELRKELIDAGDAEKGLYEQRIEGEAETRYRLLLRKAILEEIFEVEKKSNSSSKDFKDKIFDLNRFILGLDKEMVLSQEKNVVERLKLEQKYEEDELDLKLKNFVNAERIRRDNFIANAKSQEEIDDANKTFNNIKLQAEGEHSVALFKIKEKHLVDTNLLQSEIEENFSVESQKVRLERANKELDELNELIDSKDPKALAVLQAKQQEVWALEDEAFEKDRERRLKALTEQYNSVEMAEAILSEEKLIRDSERAALEVQMEVDKIEAKKAVNLEYVNWISSLGSTFRALVKENEDLSRAALFVEKAGAVAKIVVNAQAANAETLLNASTEASSYQSAAAKTAASVGGGPQGFLAAAPYIAKAASAAAIGKSRIAKNNVGAGLSIAKIMATTLGSSSLSSSGGDSSSSGAPSFTPSFNVVGNSETNQLAESIGGQINEPARAYVVYEDIQEAGNLEANAIEASGI